MDDMNQTEQIRIDKTLALKTWESKSLAKEQNSKSPAKLCLPKKTPSFVILFSIRFLFISWSISVVNTTIILFSSYSFTWSDKQCTSTIIVVILLF